MTEHKKRLYWRMCIGAIVLLSVLTFTPLVMPSNVIQPMIGGVPRTLWASILIYVVMVLLTYVGTQVYPDTDDGEGSS